MEQFDSTTMDLDHDTVSPHINFDDDFFDGKDLLKALAQAESSFPSAQTKWLCCCVQWWYWYSDCFCQAKTIGIGPIYHLRPEWKQQTRCDQGLTSLWWASIHHKK